MDCPFFYAIDRIIVPAASPEEWAELWDPAADRGFPPAAFPPPAGSHRRRHTPEPLGPSRDLRSPGRSSRGSSPHRQ